MKEPLVVIPFVLLFSVIASAFIFHKTNEPISIDSTSALVQDILLASPNILDKLAEKDDELANVLLSIRQVGLLAT